MTRLQVYFELCELTGFAVGIRWGMWKKEDEDDINFFYLSNVRGWSCY